ncbi:F-box only protein 39 [Oreochromis niloticus]|uniref:F-box only protein 39 n=1 Tax=Oreochromis niloticus TaxID=8128 RepID=UPI00022B048A|nr:F-box only protein 39 [Oreochromis niloticus]
MENLEESIGGEENYGIDQEYSDPETGEYFSDDSCDCLLDRKIMWLSLPRLCLERVFSFLPDRDRKTAALVCHQWHNVMRSPSLWRHRHFHFSGRISKFRKPHYSSAIAYVSHLGAYLERLEVTVCPPRKTQSALRLKGAITQLFSELIRVKAPLRSLAVMNLELDRSAWTSSLRASMVGCLISFLQRGSSKLNSICLSGMRNCIHQGLELLSALSHYETRFYPRCYISSLDLEAFFSGSVNVYLNSSVPDNLSQLQCLTDLRLSYSCLSDELLMALQQRHGGGRQKSRRDDNTLQTFSLHCCLKEPHQQLVCGSSWATLASSCPDLKVKISVNQVVNNDRLARMLLPEIPLSEYCMSAFYSPNEDWSPKPLLSDILPQYRHTLQHLNLDLNNFGESLDEELLELVKVCERLVKLSICAFLEIRTVARLLDMTLTQRSSLKEIHVRICSFNEDAGEEEEALEEMLSSYLHLPPDLCFSAITYPFE